MAVSKVVLTADSYDQPLEDTPRAPGLPVRVKSWTKGDSFTPRNQEEYDRLLEIDAATDPKKKRDDELADLDRRRQALEAERERIDAELQAATPAQDLKGKDLDAALEAAGLSTDGTADEKRSRLAVHQADQPPPSV